MATEFVDLERFFKRNLRFKQHWAKRNIAMKDAAWQPLKEDTWLDGCTYAKGSKFKCFETTNFGWVVFDHDSRTPDGYLPGKFIIKY